jgi:hypothetical protein
MKALSHSADLLRKRVLANSQLSILHHLLLRVLQDDDEEIRAGAAEIQSIDSSRGYSPAYALVQEWDWLKENMQDDETTAKWAMDLCLDEDGVGKSGCRPKTRLPLTNLIQSWIC